MISINELAKIMDANKSKLNYYVSLGLLKPNTTIGKMFLFDKEKALARLAEIKEYQDQGKKLTQIKEILN